MMALVMMVSVWAFVAFSTLLARRSSARGSPFIVSVSEVLWRITLNFAKKKKNKSLTINFIRCRRDHLDLNLKSNNDIEYDIKEL